MTKLVHALTSVVMLTLATSVWGQAVTFTIPGANVYPEGVALDLATGTFYVGNTENGTVYKGNVNDDPGNLEVFLPTSTDGRTVVMGMALGSWGRLFMAGGATGQAFVYDTTSGDLLRVLETPETADTLINDVAVTERAAYFTDSFRPILFRVPLTATSVGAMEPWLDFEETPLRYREGNNLDGIVASTDGRYLVAVQPNTGALYRIDTATRGVRRIVLSGSLSTGNGLLLDGQTLYVVNDEGAEIVPITLSADFRRGVVGDGFSDPSLDFPTTIAKYGERLLVVNHQSGPVTLPFTVSSIPIQTP